VIWWTVVACTTPPAAFPDRTVDYDEVVLTASARSSLESTVRYRVEPGKGGVWWVKTLRTEGVVYDDGQPITRFDSSTPRGSDAWPLVLQHAIAATPALITVDDRGRPSGLLDPDTWEVDALAAIGEAPVPAAARADTQLIDAEGFVANLARTFVGVPPRGEWVRRERVAGLLAERREACEPVERGVVRCEGRCVADDDPRGTLFGTDCWTEVAYDRDGITRIESGYAGTLVRSDGQGDAEDLPVAGQRLVLRVEAR
jgi:hypothetical protein